jgi:hypothetical protein
MSAMRTLSTIPAHAAGDSSKKARSTRDGMIPMMIVFHEKWQIGGPGHLLLGPHNTPNIKCLEVGATEFCS